MKAILILIIEKKSTLLEIFYGDWYLFMKYELLTKCDYILSGCVLWYYVYKFFNWKTNSISLLGGNLNTIFHNSSEEAKSALINIKQYIKSSNAIHEWNLVINYAKLTSNKFKLSYFRIHMYICLECLSQDGSKICGLTDLET